MNYGYSDEQENFGMGAGFFSELVNKANTGLTKVLTKSSKVSNAILSANEKLNALKKKVGLLKKPAKGLPPPSYKPAGPTAQPPRDMEAAITSDSLPAVYKGPKTLADKAVQYAPYIAAVVGGLLLMKMLTPTYHANPRRRSRR